jgi:hypothetical protein
MMKEPVVVAPKFQSFLSHIFSQLSQNITVKVKVDHSVRRNKFTVNNPLHFEKKRKQQACSLLSSGPATPFLLLATVGSSAVTIVALFWIITINPTDIKVGSSLAFSHS